MSDTESEIDRLFEANEPLSPALKAKWMKAANVDVEGMIRGGCSRQDARNALNMRNMSRHQLEKKGINWRNAAAPKAASKPAPAAKPAAAPITAAAMPHRPQTAAQARADVRTAIAQSQGLPAPKPGVAAIKATGSVAPRVAAYQPDSRRYAVTTSEHYAGREKLAARLLGQDMTASDVIAALKAAPRDGATTTANVQSVWDKAIAANWPSEAGRP